MWAMPSLVKEYQPEKILIITSGGDSPGMNAAIRAVVRSAAYFDISVLGADRGFTGLVENRLKEMTPRSVANILHRGGTVLKTDRCEAFHDPAIRAAAGERLKQQQIDGVVVIGGDGSLTGAHLLAVETGVPVVGLPGTIDNDIAGTEDSIGFDTAVNTALDAIDRIRDTAHSHERVFLVEVMGRSSGFIALAVGIAGGAEAVLLPDSPVDMAVLVQGLNESKARGKNSSLIVVAEGHDSAMTTNLVNTLSERGHQARACILGHIQRGGSPTGHDRVLASCLGASAVDHLCAGYTDVMIGIQQGKIVTVPLTRVTEESRALPEGLMVLASILGNR